MDEIKPSRDPIQSSTRRARVLSLVRSIPWAAVTTTLIGLLLAFLVRYSLLDFKSGDFFDSLKPWYNIIKSMGFAAFATNFSNYNPPYLYMLYLVLRVDPDIPPVIGVKIPGMIGDLACAYYVFRIVRLKHRASLMPIFAAMIVLFAPSMLLNSAFWGQSDSLYTAGLLACLYYLMPEKPLPAMLSYGIALAFKLQALFLAPFLFALFLRGGIKWKYAPIVLLPPAAALIPAWLAGRPILDLLNIYVEQSAHYEFITMNGPSIYAWMPQSKQVFNLFYTPAVIVGAVAAFFIVVMMYEGRRKLSRSLLLELALVSLIVIPFFLPKMHERYFFPADVFSIILALYRPRLFYIPVFVNAVSFLGYQPFLFDTKPMPLALLALVMLVVIAILVRHALRALFAMPVETPASV